VHVRLKLLQALLVLDAEMLFLIDDQKADIAELDGLAEKRVGADDDVDGSVGQPLFRLRQFLRTDQTRGLAHVDRQAAEPFRKGLEVLARQECGRDHQGHLPARHGGDEGGPESNLRLAEPDIAANQPVHRPPGRQVGEDRVDCRLLVVGFLVGELRGKLVVKPFRRRQNGGLAQGAFGGDLDQVIGDFTDALFHPRLAGLPVAAAEPVELHTGLLRPVA